MEEVTPWFLPDLWNTFYLILDTNTWIYLANGNDPKTNKYKNGYHRKLFEGLEYLLRIGKVTILTNKIILDEWTRNRPKALALASSLENKLKSDFDHLKSIQKVLGTSFDNEFAGIFDAYENIMKAQISDSEAHVSDIEKLLHSSVNVELTKDTMALVTEWAIEKKAPFKGDKKNSSADAAILFSAIEFIKKQAMDYSEGESKIVYSKSLFVSGNKGDFSSHQNELSIHEDLAPELQAVEMEFFLSLPEALNRVQPNLFDHLEIAKMQKEFDDFWDYIEYCRVCDPDEDYAHLNIIDFTEVREIEIKTIAKPDPNQLKIPFPSFSVDLTHSAQNLVSIELGRCEFCNGLNIRCLNCGAILGVHSESGQIVQCDCGINFQIDTTYDHDAIDSLMIRIVPDQEHCLDEEE